MSETETNLHRRVVAILSYLQWPPFLSFSVRTQHSIIKGASLRAKCVKISKSKDAPRLSELLTNMYLNPSFSKASKRPDPTKAAYRSPCPGGHHSFSGLAGHVAGYKRKQTLELFGTGG